MNPSSEQSNQSENFSSQVTQFTTQEMNTPQSNVGPNSVPLNSMNMLSTTVQNPLIIPSRSHGKRDMTFKNYVPCGGPNFDPLLDDWSRFVVVADDGDIPDRGNALNRMETRFLSVDDVSDHLHTLDDLLNILLGGPVGGQLRTQRSKNLCVLDRSKDRSCIGAMSAFWFLDRRTIFHHCRSLLW